MKSATKRTFAAALLLAAMAAAVPFLCLLPLVSVNRNTGAEQSSPASSAAPAPSDPSDPSSAAGAVRADPAPILLWDEAAGQTKSVSAREYLMGAAACEMPAEWPAEALKAQMVASHSYALSQLAQGSSTALTVNSAQCSGWTDAQVLQSRWGEDFDRYWQRLGELADQVTDQLLLYQGTPAAACYHAISSGHTQASQRVWEEALPYLQGVDSSWDKTADGYQVSVQYTAQQLSDALSSALGVQVSGSPDSWVGQTRWDEAGYVQTVSLCGTDLSGTRVRTALGLRSACFSIAWQDGQFTITTRGYGHGVGLSQAGARAMAEGGSSWQEILLYYFPGTEIGTL